MNTSITDQVQAKSTDETNVKVCISEDEKDFLIAQYQVLSERRANHNSLLWSVPSWLFVAQAFLWNIGLDKSVPNAIRIVISVISVIIGFATWQCFERNRLMEIVDTEQMYMIETIFRRMNEHTPILVVSHKLSKRTWYKDNSRPFAEQENNDTTQHNLTDDGQKHISNFIADGKHKVGNYLNEKKSTNVWRFIFVVMIVASIIILGVNCTGTAFCRTQ